MLEDNLSQSTISDHYVTSGTLGDMFAVYCKVAGLRRDGFLKPIHLRHFTKFPQFRQVCNSLIALLPDVSIDFESATVSRGETIARVCALVQEGIPHINGKHNGISPIKILNDPEYIRMEPYPKIDLPVDIPDLEPHMFHVGIQLHSGKIGGNFKGFSLLWLRSVARKNDNKNLKLHLFGTGDGYQVPDINQMCKSAGIVNHVGKTSFYQWLALLRGMDLLISPEGFAPFFAMSQRVKTMFFYRNKTIVSRVHPDWRYHSIGMSIEETGVLRRLINRVSFKIRDRRLLVTPLSVNQMVSIIHNEFYARTPDEKNL